MATQVHCIRRICESDMFALTCYVSSGSVAYKYRVRIGVIVPFCLLGVFPAACSLDFAVSRMSSPSPRDNVSAAAPNPDRADVAVVRRADGRTLRKSCDRCYQQKLRCLRDNASLTRCKRCQRAGLECVYGSRSSKKASQCSINASDIQGNGAAYLAVPASNDPMGELEAMFSFEPTQFGDVFPASPSAWPAAGDSVLSVAYKLPVLEHGSGTFASSAISMPMLSSQSFLDGGDGSMSELADLSAELADSFQKLEALFLKTVDDQSRRDTQDYPVGEVLNALDDFVGVLQLDDMVGTGIPNTPQSPRDAHMRNKQASIAAQGYVLCVRLLASLSEQMLQSLLASPLRSASGNPASPDGSQNANSPEATPRTQERRFSDASHIPRNLRLGDLHVPPDHFGNALDSSVNLLHIGSRRLNEMEHLLSIPSKQRAGSMKSIDRAEKEVLTQQAFPDQDSSKTSLPARFVASIWEDEASMSKSPVVLLQRCRAAILGLIRHPG
ncbi:hypothetical protein GQ53DRAFT_819504 [Thozetella sp. PMI_491]|nr:hypothetical protein GQ53DRAFT_819504 [Thozetella sp. PMI_491]